MKRRKMSRKGSKKLFTATAQHVKPLNVRAVLRGGIRL